LDWGHLAGPVWELADRRPIFAKNVWFQAPKPW